MLLLCGEGLALPDDEARTWRRAQEGDACPFRERQRERTGAGVESAVMLPWRETRGVERGRPPWR